MTQNSLPSCSALPRWPRSLSLTTEPRAATSRAAESARNRHVVAGRVRPADRSGRRPVRGPIRPRWQQSSRAPKRTCGSPESRARHLHARRRSLPRRPDASAAAVQRDNRRRPRARRRCRCCARARSAWPCRGPAAVHDRRRLGRGRGVGARARVVGHARAHCRQRARVFDLPGTVADVRVEPGAITRTSTSAGLTRVEATLVPAARPGSPGPRDKSRRRSRATRARWPM